MPFPNPLKLIYVEWDDADSISRWMHTEEVETYIRTYTPIRQSGFVLHESDQLLVLAGSICPADEFKDQTYGNVIRIPKPWIHKRMTLLTVSETGIVTRK